SSPSKLAEAGRAARLQAQCGRMVVKPLFVKPGQLHFKTVCARCVDEKNARTNGRSWKNGETMDDVTVYGRIDLADDMGWAGCREGEGGLVVRMGGQGAQNFR